MEKLWSPLFGCMCLFSTQGSKGLGVRPRSSKKDRPWKLRRWGLLRPLCNHEDPSWCQFKFGRSEPLTDWMQQRILWQKYKSSVWPPCNFTWCRLSAEDTDGLAYSLVCLFLCLFAFMCDMMETWYVGMVIRRSLGIPDNGHTYLIIFTSINGRHL